MNKFAILRPSRFVLLAGVATGASMAQAAAIDVTAVVTDVAAQLTPIGLIGSAVLLVYVGVKAFKWVRGALS
ncbi:MAG: hypothetical protein KJ565_16020 [Gammaproteobacteria bacterium]|uniref:major capsid protein n=1 Tax=Hydrogenophaga sp. TaxID=1904254 RepID=UPI0025BD7741|nr:major capsid protein [Hydrogenophaga sp.]MBU4183198.1 hypothetical protein [Gammaproteobacteria bacterium]MBU4324064.1 hypothetical protein [Gammaproteobacteria bacterium]MBU4509362.1 hypothetical protein [Gammaproteobacteria bacterium]MCG2655787.1 major capsid protein [Hydrogenophaga sp.]